MKKTGFAARAGFTALSIGLLACGPAHAETVQEAAAAFGARQSILNISLSPSGNKIAYISPNGAAGEAVFVVNLSGEAVAKPILTNSDINSDIDYCAWLSDSRLVCNLSIVDNSSGEIIGFSRLIVVNSDGSKLQMLTRHRSYRALGLNQFGGEIIALEVDGDPDKILMTRQYLPEVTIGTRTASKAQGLGVDLVDIKSLKTRKQEPPERDAGEYIADDTGKVRIMMRQPTDSQGRLSDHQYFTYRKPGSTKWEDLAQDIVDGQTSSGFRPVAVDARSNLAYGFDQVDGNEALVSIALDGSMKQETVLARKDVDVDQLIRIGRRNRVVGASYATEKRQIQYIDPQLRDLSNALGAALPGKPLVDIIDANEGEGSLLIVASSDTDPGMTYLYNKATRQLNELLPLRRQLVGHPMGQMRPISYKAADGTEIPGYLTLPPGVSDAKGLPGIVMPHGGPSARDEWGFDWLVQFFADRGYAVLQPNFRGSSGYGSAWFGHNGFQSWKTAVGDVNDAGRWLVSQGIANPKKLAIVGWSYGGYAALQSQVLDPELYKAVVAIAPVTDLDKLREESRNFTNYSLVDKFIGHGDHVEAGSPDKNIDRFIAPVLLVHGTMDQNVGVEQSRLMDEKLKDAGKRVEYIEFDGLRHSLADSNARARMLVAIDGFLSQNLGR